MGLARRLLVVAVLGMFAGGDARLLDVPVDPPIGVDPAAPLAAVTVPLPASGTLLAFTDGLVERRGEVIDAGLDRLRAHAAERGTDMATLALAWVMTNPLVTAPIVGPRRPEQLEPARRALDIHLTEDERATIAGFFEAA